MERKRHQPQTVFDKRGKSTAFRGSFALGAIEQFRRQAGGGSLWHMSRHIVGKAICQLAWEPQERCS